MFQQSPQRDRNAGSHLYLDENVMAPSALRHRRSPHKRYCHFSIFIVINIWLLYLYIFAK